MIKIAHLNPTQTWRGGEQQTLYLAKYLQTQNQIQQFIIGNPNSQLEAKCKQEQIAYHSIRIRGEWDFYSAYRLSKWIQQHKIQIVHAHTAKAHTIGLLAKWLCIKNNYPLILVVSRRVDFSFQKDTTKWIYIIKNYISKKKYYSSLIDSYIAISNHVKNILSSDGVDTRKIHVIYSGIDLKRFQNKINKKKIKTLKKELGIQNHHIVMGNVAALVDHKDHKTLLQAISILKKKTLPPWKLIIVGDGELKKTLYHLRQKLQLEELVIFTGYRNDVFDFFPIFDLFVMSSKEEGLGTSILDAMAYGLPIVATRGGGIPEMIVENQGGLLSSIQDPEQLAENLSILIQNPVLRSQMGRFNQNHVRQFDYRKTGEKTLSLYETLLKK